MQEKSFKDLIMENKGKEVVVYFMGKLVVVVVKVGYIVNFIGSSGMKGSMLNFSIVDKMDCMLVILSDENQMMKIREGKIMQLRNFFVKGNRVVLFIYLKIMCVFYFNLMKEQIDKVVLFIILILFFKIIREVLDMFIMGIILVQGQVIWVSIM